MAILTGPFRLGRDAERKKGANGDFLTLSLAYDYYDGSEEKTQWVSATLNGQRIDRLEPLLKSGTMVFLTVENVHVREFIRQGEKAFALSGRVGSTVEFIGGCRKPEDAGTGE